MDNFGQLTSRPSSAPPRLVEQVILRRPTPFSPFALPTTQSHPNVTRHNSREYFSEEDRQLPSIKDSPSAAKSITLPPFSTISRIADQSARRPQIPSSSIFNAPTGVYAWDRLKLASELKYRPHMTVVYHPESPNPRSAPPPTASGDLGTNDFQAPEATYGSATRKRKVPDYMRKDVFCTPPAQRPFKGQHLPLSTTSSDNEPCEQARVMHPSTDLAVAEPFQFSLRTLPSDSGSDDPTISSPTSQRYNWKIWARWEPGPRHKIFHCLWPSQDGKRQYCGYSSKKQLVKRHIEGTHLRLKPFQCEWCNKSFPQKSSLEIHKSSHTGETPHECKFQCGLKFSDPARRHKHQVEAHQYQPKSGNRVRPQELTEHLENLKPA